MRVTVSGDPPCPLPPVSAALRAALAGSGLPRDTRVSVAFVSDDEMRALNRRHRRIDRTTDVLSFGQRLPRGAKGADVVRRLVREVDGSLELGDVVISGAQALRQAKRRGHPVAREVAFLAAHGGLHLLGYEDETSAGRAEMIRLGEAALGAKRRRPARGRT